MFLKTRRIIKPKKNDVCLRDPYRSKLTPKETKKFRQDAAISQETLKAPRILNQSVDETIDQGVELAKQHNRKIASEALLNL